MCLQHRARDFAELFYRERQFLNTIEISIYKSCSYNCPISWTINAAQLGQDGTKERSFNDEKCLSLTPTTRVLRLGYERRNGED